MIALGLADDRVAARRGFHRSATHGAAETASGAKIVDFFVSYTPADRNWAEWIAGQLERAGYRVMVRAWDSAPGSNWVVDTDQAVATAHRTIAVVSAAYLYSGYEQAPWRVAWSNDPDGAKRKLLVVRVEDCPRPGLLGLVVPVDLFRIGENRARRALLDAARRAVTGGRAKPPTPPGFPTNGPAFPGTDHGADDDQEPEENG